MLLNSSRKSAMCPCRRRLTRWLSSAWMLELRDPCLEGRARKWVFALTTCSSARAMPQSSATLAYLTQRRPASERLVKYLLLACAAISIATTTGIVLVLVFETLGFFREVSLTQFLLDTQWTPLFADKHFGIWVLAS